MNAFQRRRRALMMMQGGTQTFPLSDLPAGTGVKIGTDQYILTQKWTITAELYKESVLPTSMKMHSAGGTPSDYENSIVDEYLTSTFANSLPSGLSQYLILNTISYAMVVSGGTSTTTKTIQRSIVVPEYNGLADNSTVVGVLKTYFGTTDANTARISKNSGTAVEYWLRDAWTNGSSFNQHTVMSTGSRYRRGRTNSYYVRPVIYISLSTPVKIVGNEYVLSV